MPSKGNVKLPPIVNTDNKAKGKPDEIEHSSESESGLSSTSSKKFKSFKQVVNVVGKNTKWTKDASEEVQEDQSKKIAKGERRLTFNVTGKVLLSDVLLEIRTCFCGHQMHGKARKIHSYLITLSGHYPFPNLLVT